MKIKSQKDFWSGLMFVIVGIAFAWGATNYNFGSSAKPGPGYFPLGLGVLMALLGSLVLFKALTIETDGGDPIGSFAWRPLVVIIGSVALFGALLPRAGLFVSLPVLVIGSSMASPEFTWRGSVINSVVLTAMSWVMFIWGLKLTLPLWPVWLGAS